MKEASGEANMTVVTIILIGVIVAVATPIITSMMSSTQRRACCMEAGGTWQGNQCSGYNTTQYNECASAKNGTNGTEKINQ